MPKSKIGPAIRKEDYEAFLQISPDLPDTFGEWARRTAEIDRRLKAQGVAVDRIIIEPGEFAQWTSFKTLGRDEIARRAFAIFKDRRAPRK
jgi:hypothetical protein